KRQIHPFVTGTKYALIAGAGKRKAGPMGPAFRQWLSPAARAGLPHDAVPDVDRRARDLEQLVEEQRGVGRDPHAAVRYRAQRDRVATVDRELPADEEHRVVHVAERHLEVAGLEGQRLVVPGRGDRVAAHVLVGLRVAEV